MRQFASRFLSDEKGGTAIEYGLIGAGIFLAIITAVTQVGVQLTTVFSNVKSNL